MSKLDLASAADMALTQMEQCAKQYRDDPSYMTALNALRDALKSPSARPTVFVLLIDNECGLNATTHATRESADAALLTYVNDNWSSMPKSVKRITYTEHGADSKIAAYFGACDDRSEIIETEIED